VYLGIAWLMLQTTATSLGDAETAALAEQQTNAMVKQAWNFDAPAGL